MTRKFALLAVGMAVLLCGCDQFFIYKAPPEAVIGIEKVRIQPNEPIWVSAEGSFSPQGYPLVQFIWGFGDGAPPQTRTDPYAVSHSYNQGGPYAITLEVVDSLGMRGRSSVGISVNKWITTHVRVEELPGPLAGEYVYIIQRGHQPKRVSISGIIPDYSYIFYRLDATNSYDSDGWVYSWKWYWSDHELGEEPILYVRIPAGSVYTIQLQATDNEGLVAKHFVDVGRL